ncbi:phosphatidate cytidylyltransferase, partial [bacterium]
PHLSLSRLLLIPLVGGIIIPLGDLIESAMKRDFGVKDTGTAIPGHGGFMDRFDSWAFTFPVVYYLLVWMKGG